MVPMPARPRWNPLRRQPAAGATPSTEFKDLQPGEHVLAVWRPHPLWVVVGSWRLVVFLVVLFGLYLFVRVLAAFSAPLPFIVLGVFLLFSVHVIRWIGQDLNYWLFRKYILTDWRLVDSWGAVYQYRDQAQLDHIQHMQLNRANLIAALFDIGDVHVMTSSVESDVHLDGVHHPREIVRRIYSAQVMHGPVGPQPVEVRHPAIRAIWPKLAAPDETPLTTSPLGRLTPRGRVPGHPPIAMLNGEQVLDRYHRHPIVFLRQLLLPLGVTAGGFFIGWLYSVSNTAHLGSLPAVFMLGSLLVALLWSVILWLNYIDDFFLLTTHRVVDVDRLFFVLSESRREAMYSKVQDVRVEVTLWGQLFGYGHITVETAGRTPNIRMDHIPNALDVQNRIQACATAAKERGDMKQRQMRHGREFHRWMANVLNEVVVEVPDVRGVGLLDAAAHLRPLGLRLVVEAERPALGVPPGVVLDQVPLVGTTAVRGNEVRVTLSRRAATATAGLPATAP